MKSQVSIRRDCDYVFENLQIELAHLMDLLGGMSRFVRSGDKVLLKVNLLSPKEPEEAVTTHPMIVKALCREIKNQGAVPIVGDSSGGVTIRTSRTAQALEKSEIAEVVREENGELVNFDESGSIKYYLDIAGKQTEIFVAKPVVEADVIINLPKLKTHGFTYFTGSIKNMFGVLPGNQKRDFHRKFPGMNSFSQLLAQIYHQVQPDLTIMDGIWSMEGNGPSGGKRRDLGLLLASEDGVALDEVASRIIGYKPGQVKTTKFAAEYGYGTKDIANIEISHDLAELYVSDFDLPTTSMASLVEWVPPILTKLVINQLRTAPIIDQSQCIKCGLCKNSCPVNAIVIIDSNSDDKMYWVETDKCIECYCCHELCPANAISIEFRTKLGRLVASLRDN